MLSLLVKFESDSKYKKVMKLWLLKHGYKEILFVTSSNLIPYYNIKKIYTFYEKHVIYYLSIKANRIWINKLGYVKCDKTISSQTLHLCTVGMCLIWQKVYCFSSELSWTLVSCLVDIKYFINRHFNYIILCKQIICCFLGITSILQRWESSAVRRNFVDCKFVCTGL